jgi:HK97 gp10 family phage protein
MARSPQSLRLERRLEAIPKAVRAALKPALAASGNELAALMKQLAPEDEGDLKESIAVTLPGESTPAYSQPGGSRVVGELEVLVTVGNHAVRYPHLQEYGTAHHEAQPFFWPAFRLLRKKLDSRIKRAVGKAVRDEARRS